MRTRSWRCAVVAVGIVLCSLLSMISDGDARPAQAATGWPVQLDPRQATGQLLTHPDGGVSVSGCRYRSDPSRNHDMTTYTPAAGFRGHVISPSDHQIDFCRPWTVTGREGGLYVLNWIPSRNKNYVTAYRDGTYQWSLTVSGDCPASTSGAKRGMVAGPNGDLYLMLEECNQLSLVGVTSQGRLKFRHNLGFSQDTGGQRNGQILAYRDGLVVLQNNAHNSHATSLRYFDYTGRENVSRRFSEKLLAYETYGEWGISYEGVLYLAVNRRWAREQPCAVPVLTNRIMIFKSSTSVRMTAYQTEQLCLLAGQVLPTPTGTAIIVHQRTEDFDYNHVPRGNSLYVVTADGRITARPITPTWGSSDSSPHITAQVGINGNLVIHRWIRWMVAGRHQWVSEWIISDPFGRELARNSSANKLPTSLEGDTFAVPTGDLWAVTNSAIYAVMCDTTFASQDCPPTKAKLFRLPFVEAGADYPGGKIAGETPLAPAQLDLVVLGDSFSSGEGVEPFLIKPSTGDVDPCHRSQLAYGQLLANDPALSVRLQNFAACSGATSSHLVDPGQHGELAQMEAITKDTDIVAMTIGGNDVDFRSFAESCTFLDCSEEGDDRILHNIRTRLGDNLYRRFLRVRQHAQGIGSTAKIYVIGYPRFVPPRGERPLVAPRCLQLTDTEADVILTVTDRLSQEVALQARRAGITFLSASNEGSPFRGHELCTNRSSVYYFHGAMRPEGYSYHPNANGQKAYAELAGKGMTLQ